MSHYHRQGGPGQPHDSYEDQQQPYYTDQAHSGYDHHSYHQQQLYHAAYDAAQPEYQAAPVKPQR